MTLRTRFILYLAVLHLVAGTAAVLFLRHRGVWFFAAEGLFVLSLVTGIVLVRRLFEPIRVIRNGIELIRSSEYGTRFREIGQADLDPLIRLYNRMADRLREERIRSEEQEHFLQRIIGLSPTGVLTLDLDGRVAMANESAASLLQSDAGTLRGKKLDEIGSPFADEVARLDVDETRVLSLQGRRRIKCRVLTFMDRGFPRRFLLMDELTEELHRSEKRAYEKLIRVMSHEVNNTAGAVSSLLDSCLAYREQIGPEDREDFTKALSVAIGRTGRMNRFMQEFAEVVRLPEPNRRRLDLRMLLEEIAVLFRDESERRGIEWRWEGGPEPVFVDADPVQMEQVLINIFKNALEAIEGSGAVTVRLQGAGERTTLVVEDTGRGMPPEIRENLFTPFYSSKENGQGIGLTLVREVLLRHGFDFGLESPAPGRTEFTIRF